MFKPLQKIPLPHREAEVGATGFLGETKQLKILT